MNKLENELKEAIEKAEKIYEVYYTVVFGGTDDEASIDGKTVYSLKKMMKDAINNAILSGNIEVPEGKIITDIYVNPEGELIIDTKDL